MLFIILSILSIIVIVILAFRNIEYYDPVSYTITLAFLTSMGVILALFIASCFLDIHGGGDIRFERRSVKLQKIHEFNGINIYSNAYFEKYNGAIILDGAESMKKIVDDNNIYYLRLKYGTTDVCVLPYNGEPKLEYVYRINKSWYALGLESLNKIELYVKK